MTQSTIAGDRIPPRPSSTVLHITDEIQLRIDLATDPHDDGVTLEFRDLQVTITQREAAYAARQGLAADTHLVLIDRDETSPRPIAVYLDDDVVLDLGR